MPEWIKGIPPVELVAKHEQEHPARMRPNPFVSDRITVARQDHLGGDYVSVANDASCGNWLCVHDYEHFDAVLPACHRLRVVNGEILFSAGFTMWIPLTETNWAAESMWLPVKWDGTPVDYDGEAPRA